MRTHMSLEIPRVPQLPDQLAESFHQTRHNIPGHDRHTGVALLPHEIVPNRRHIDQRLQDHISIVVRLYIIKTHDARQIMSTVVGARQLRVALEVFYLVQ